MLSTGSATIMAWRYYRKQDASSLVSFLKGEEWRGVAFSSRFRESLSLRWAAKPSFQILVNERRSAGRDTICEAVMLSQYGLVVPILNESGVLNLRHSLELSAFLKRYQSRLHSIMGSSESVTRMAGLFDIRPKLQIDYHLMVVDLEDYRATGRCEVPDLVIRPVGPEDAPRLFEVQKQYEIEEVFINPEMFDEKRCRSRLRKDLRKQVVFAAERNGTVVSKAGTNARGFKTDQLGGVFTRVDLRGRGIATVVMDALLEHLRQTRAAASLFVKKHNRSAVALYSKLGFENRGGFRIVYYDSVK